MSRSQDPELPVQDLDRRSGKPAPISADMERWLGLDPRPPVSVTATARPISTPAATNSTLRPLETPEQLDEELEAIGLRLSLILANEAPYAWRDCRRSIAIAIARARREIKAIAKKRAAPAAAAGGSR